MLGALRMRAGGVRAFQSAAVARKASPRPQPSAVDPRRAPRMREEQKWTTKTMVALSTSVGATTFYLGALQGFSQGEARAYARIRAEQEERKAAADSAAVPLDADIQSSGGVLRG